jgi:hypothetical protein
MEIKRGTRVSLNKKVRSYYFQGENGINLRADLEDTAIIPEDISDRNLQMVQKAVLGGHLVVGWTKEPEIKAPDRRNDIDLLDMNVKKMQPYLEKIAQTPGKHEEAPVARLEKLLSAEKADKNRKTVVEKIEELLGMMGGISAVEEDDGDKEQVEIQIA